MGGERIKTLRGTGYVLALAHTEGDADLDAPEGAAEP
jgi:hypothetical protein